MAEALAKVISALQLDGKEVMAAQYGLDTPERDVATVQRGVPELATNGNGFLDAQEVPNRTVPVVLRLGLLNDR